MCSRILGLAREVIFAALFGGGRVMDAFTIAFRTPNLLRDLFAESFPGRIGRFSDGQREVVIRWISAPTRKLHAASDCFRGSGYRVKPLPLQRASGMTWGAFSAERGTLRLYVREVIIDASGQRWTDVSAWYWASVRGGTQAPWWAITVAASGTGEVAMSNVPLASAE